MFSCRKKSRWSVFIIFEVCLFKMSTTPMNRKLLSIKEVEFPFKFSPLATSSPIAKKTANNSFLSTSSGSEGNLTERAIKGVDESLIADKSDCSLLSFQTAIEYVDGNAFMPTKFRLPHDSVRAALEICAQKTWPSNTPSAYKEIALQRYLWDARSIWRSYTMVQEPGTVIQFLCKDGLTKSYINNLIGFTYYKLIDISVNDIFDKQNMFDYFIERGIPSTIIDRLFEGVVTKGRKEILNVAEASHFIFALYGMDEYQSIEYWFRIFDVEGLGYLDQKHLEIHYNEVVKFLRKIGIEALKFDQVFDMFSEILGTRKWTLKILKKSPTITVRVLSAFTNALKFYDFETNERMNTEREDDEMFGEHRNCWRRELDHAYDSFYDQEDISQ
ncbi:unnamed protein product [Caenorhabditis angaria]|uniref:EF-hand domain-containing protein n=1 Tax=Caenorhabditis angaria TaxID=860376 RepID=A0A9P1I6A9_9PELO|nr:unnamed protein product [Caenorhabditis angaria]